MYGVLLTAKRVSSKSKLSLKYTNFEKSKKNVLEFEFGRFSPKIKAL